VPRHPSQLYEAGSRAWCCSLILAVRRVDKAKLLAKPRLCDGHLPVRYGLSRASLENVRQPDAGMLSTSRSA
jgi:phosphatidylglycerol:prolipoprotein diacylglycerol transferase